jgi:hypothetical protein
MTTMSSVPALGIAGGVVAGLGLAIGAQQFVNPRVDAEDRAAVPLMSAASLLMIMGVGTAAIPVQGAMKSGLAAGLLFAGGAAAAGLGAGIVMGMAPTLAELSA